MVGTTVDDIRRNLPYWQKVAQRAESKDGRQRAVFDDQHGSYVCGLADVKTKCPVVWKTGDPLETACSLF